MSWFVDWFDSPYYHILYQNRDEKEAERFIDNLIDKIPLNLPANILDLACGKGRHSRYLNSKGFDVLGIDLSKSNIEYADKSENSKLHFKVDDMRHFDLNESFHYILNLFTSFGYFDYEYDDVKVYKNVYRHLNQNGLFIQDYLNAVYIEKNLVEKETKELDGIQFNINRQIKDGYIIKNIEFEDKGKKFQFQEKVKIYYLDDFKKLAKESNLMIQNTFGDYQLNPYNEEESPRLILIYRKR